MVRARIDITFNSEQWKILKRMDLDTNSGNYNV